MEIDAGARVYRSQCSQCHGPNGDQVTGIDLRRAQFRRAATDEDLAAVITTGIVQTGMPPFALQPPELIGVIAYIRAGFDNSADVKIGNAARGRAVFAGKGACGSCHRVNGQGPRTAPDLSDVGRLRRAAELARALLNPEGAVRPQNRTVKVVTRDGTTISGRLLNHDTFTVLMLDAMERLRSFSKADLREVAIGKTSSKTSYRDKLTAQEIADVVGYLISLKVTKAVTP